MNCKQGDLAVIVRSQLPQFLGLPVTCVKFLGTTSYLGPSGMLCVGEDMWEIDLDPQKVQPGTPAGRTVLSDRHLRPIRDTDGDDETLTWAGRPASTPLTTPQPTKENA